MVKIEAAHSRLFQNVFVCKNCKAKIRADPKKIREGKIKCRKCGCKKFRPKRKK